MKLRYTDRAKTDIESAFAWYERQRIGLGDEFLSCVEQALLSIQQNPKLYQIYYAVFRRCVIKRFPFSVFYSIEAEIVVIHAVFDNRQDPEKRP